MSSLLFIIFISYSLFLTTSKQNYISKTKKKANLFYGIVYTMSMALATIPIFLEDYGPIGNYQYCWL